MQKTIEKFSLYDFFGYIIPGFLGVWALNGFFSILKINFLAFDNEDFINSVLFIGISYFVGFILHEVSEWFQSIFYKKLWKGMPSEKYLLDTDSKYSTDFKAKLKIMIKTKYNIEQINSPQICQEVFNLLYSELQAKGKDNKAQLFNAIYGMCRNFIAATMLCIILFVTQSIIIIINLGILQNTENFAYLFVFIVSLLILSRRLKRFGERFADYVIRDSYNLFKETNDN